MGDRGVACRANLLCRLNAGVRRFGDFRSPLAGDVVSLPICVAELQPNYGDNAMSLGTILIIILVIALLGGFSGLGGGPFYGTGYYGGGGLGLIIVILLILVLLGKL